MSWRLEQDGFIKTWAQDVRNSYLIKLKYVLVPKGVKTDVRYIDTPYRFQTYQEARAYAKELFPCYSYAIQGSADRPNFNDSQFIQRIPKDEIHDIKYYDLYGVKPSYIKTNNIKLGSRRNYENQPSLQKENNSSKVINNSKNKLIENSLEKGKNIKSKNISNKQPEHPFVRKQENEINKRLEDIDVLRRKLDEKEKELITIKKQNNLK